MEFNRSVDITTLPKANIGRSVFDLSHPLYTTFNTGQLIPILAEDVLPGDSFRIKSSYLARLQTLLTPMMGQIYLDQYYFFIPNRLVFANWAEMLGENKTGYWTQQTQYTEPTAIKPQSGATYVKQYSAKSIGDYMGIPTQTNLSSSTAPSALPFRAYCMVWNEFFRDENLQDPVVIDTSATSPVVLTSTDLTQKANILSYAQTGLTAPLPANKYHDLFTSSLPSPLRGMEATVPIGGKIPIKAFSTGFSDSDLMDGSAIMPYVMKSFTGSSGTSTSSISSGMDLVINNSGQVSRVTNSSVTTNTNHPVFSNVGVDLGEATMATINDLRLSFATQRYYEALARSGSRYTEILSGLFGVESGDSRLQRPEYIGGSHSVLNVEQIVQTSESSSNSPLGETGAYSLSFGSDDVVEYSATEHGWIIGVCAVRYEHNYQQGIPRRFLRRTKFDYYWPQFANIGEVPIYKKELYIDAANGTDDQVFGYQEAWFDYRYRSSANVTGEMRSNYAQSLDVWHLADDYNAAPSLSDDWIREDKSPVDRVLTVGSSVADQILANFFFDIKATRPLPVYSIPGGLDMR